MERAAVVSLLTPKNREEAAAASLEELKRLLETAGGTAVREFVQYRPKPEPATLVGKGKAAEIALAVQSEKLDLVVFDEELTPTQQRHLEEILSPAKVLDRTHLILDIFAQRARSREGQLQVELAQLNYLLPRLTQKFGRFEQQTGGIGTRGPGERKLEVDQRHIRRRLERLKTDVEKLQRQRRRLRQNREGVPIPTVALVGYTNVGKSSLLNALADTGKNGVYADDKLFATLDPTTRRFKLPGGGQALLTDTVGFIQKLPTHLVASFHATLEEAASAQLLLHVTDAASPRWAQEHAVVQDVLKRLGADRVPTLLVHNKADLLSAAQREALRRQGRIPLSARTREGLAELTVHIESKLEEPLLTKDVWVPHTHPAIGPWLHRVSHVLMEQPEANGMRYRLRLSEKQWGQLQKELSL